MREIKFRAWDKSTKSMSPPRTIEDLCIMKDTLVDFAILDGNLEFLQYTGLKDKNGTEIYEGDIVKHFEHTAYGWRKEPDYWLIGGEFTSGRINGVMVWGIDFGDTYGLDSEEHYRDLEVIFNIYENPELLDKS